MRAKPLLARGLDGLAHLAVRQPKRVLAGALGLLVLALVASALGLGLKTSNLDLIDPEHPEVAAFRAFAREFGSPNPLVVVLEGDGPAELGAAARTLLPRLAASPGVANVLGELPFAPGGPGLLAARSPWFLSRDGKMLFLFVQPDDPESQATTLGPFVQGVKAAVTTAGLAPGIRVGYTGLPAYALDDRDFIAHDISRLSGLSFLLVLGLFAGAFASFWRPVLVMTTLLAATGLLMGAAVLWPGHLTLLSSFFGSIVFGMGVDFGILIVDRFEERLAEGDSAAVAITTSIERLSPGLATGALTTAMGFFAMLATGFLGFAELGFLAGLGIVISLLAMVTVLPALLVVVPRRQHRERRLGERRIGRVLLRLQHPALAAGLAGLALASLFAPGPGFDSDYLALEPRGSDAVRLERAMVERSDYSPQFAAFTVSSRAELDRLATTLRQEPTVAAVHSVADLDLAASFGARPSTGAEAFRSRFVSPAGRFALYAYPKGDVWDPAVRDRFLERMRAIDPGATGMPFLGRTMIDLSHRALAIAGALAVLILVVCVWLDLRNVRLALVALLPTVLGLALLRALMHVFHIPWNPLNVMALPVVIGVGEDNAVHLLHRLLEERGDLGRALAGTGRSLVLTSGTTAASFAALSFAAHQGLASFAQALALGITATLAMSLFVLPTAATWLLPRLGAAPPLPGDPDEPRYLVPATAADAGPTHEPPR